MLFLQVPENPGCACRAMDVSDPSRLRSLFNCLFPVVGGKESMSRKKLFASHLPNESSSLAFTASTPTLRHHPRNRTMARVPTRLPYGAFASILNAGARCVPFPDLVINLSAAHLIHSLHVAAA